MREKHLYEFGPYRLLPHQRQLLTTDDQPVKLGGRAFDMGYRQEAVTRAHQNLKAWRAAGAELVVTVTRLLSELTFPAASTARTV